MVKETSNKSQESNKKKNPRNKKPVILVSLAVIAIAIIIIFVLPKKSGTESETTDTEYMFKKEGELTFTDSLGNEKSKIDIEIADTDFDRQLGLMFRKQMDQDKGMLFIFDSEEPQSFWMHNTFISLDMIFVDAQKRIVTIHPNTATLSDQSYPSSKPALYVIEVVAGYTAKHNIKEGDKVAFIELTKKL